jgi:P27 family predicted phage terminase small subunit
MRGAKPHTLTVINGGIVDAVEAPRGLPAAAVNDWNVVTADLASRKLLTEATLSIVEVYCTALWQVRECRQVIVDHGTFVKGQNGVPKANPASTMMQKAQDTVNRLSAELGLTPSSRSRRGLGGEQAPKADDGVGDMI